MLRHKNKTTTLIKEMDILDRLVNLCYKCNNKSSLWRVPCGHIYCVDCIRQSKNCPQCFKVIDGQKIFPDEWIDLLGSKTSNLANIFHKLSDDNDDEKKIEEKNVTESQAQIVNIRSMETQCDIPIVQSVASQTENSLEDYHVCCIERNLEKISNLNLCKPFDLIIKGLLKLSSVSEKEKSTNQPHPSDLPSSNFFTYHPITPVENPVNHISNHSSPNNLIESSNRIDTDTVSDHPVITPKLEKVSITTDVAITDSPVRLPMEESSIKTDITGTPVIKFKNEPEKLSNECHFASEKTLSKENFRKIVIDDDDSQHLTTQIEVVSENGHEPLNVSNKIVEKPLETLESPPLKKKRQLRQPSTSTLAKPEPTPREKHKISLDPASNESETEQKVARNKKNQKEKSGKKSTSEAKSKFSEPKARISGRKRQNIDSIQIEQEKLPKRSRSSSKEKEKYVIMCSGLDPIQRHKFDKFAFSLEFEVVDKWTPSITHLVVNIEKDVDKKARLTRRSIKYLMALLGNKWIVSYEWINDSFRSGKFLDEGKYEIQGVKKCPKLDCPKRSRLEKTSFFHNYAIQFDGNFPVSIDELKILVQIGKGIVIENEEEFNNLDGNLKCIVVTENLALLETQDSIKFVAFANFLDSISCLEPL